MSVKCPLCNSKFEYSAYLQTEHWKNKRLLKLSQADNRCQICNSSDNLCVHHRVYGNLFSENENDLIVLCNSCHQLYHKNNILQSPKTKPTIPTIKDLFPDKNRDYVIPWFEELPIEKVDLDRFWEEFLSAVKGYNRSIFIVLKHKSFNFLGFDSDQDSAFIEYDNGFATYPFDDPDKLKELNKYFKEFCNKKIEIVAKDAHALQVIK